MSDHASTHEAPAAVPAVEGSNIVQQVLWVLAAILLILAIWRTVAELSGDAPKTEGVTEWFKNFRFGAPELGGPSLEEIVAEHKLQPGEVWATEKLSGKMTIEADGHKFEVQFSGCNSFTEFNGEQTSFPSCAEAGPALIKMGEGEKKPFLVHIIKKK